MNHSPSHWIAFNLVILILIVVDLYHSRSKSTDKDNLKSVVLTSIFWVALALVFNCGVFYFLGREAGLDFLAGYLIEKSLSIDNVFVFIMLFKYFKTPKQYQHKILFLGVLGAIVMRAVMIVGGLALVHSFGWVLYIFGAFLVISGIKMAYPKHEDLHPDQNVMLKFLERWIPITQSYENGRFFIKSAVGSSDGSSRWCATPLFAILLCIESADLVFALDSIPAVMSITLDPFIIYTSNVFAILGLRSLFFVLAELVNLFHLLHYALAVILVFVGLKMLLAHFIEVSVVVSLCFIFFTLVVAMIASVCYRRPNST